MYSENGTCLLPLLCHVVSLEVWGCWVSMNLGSARMHGIFSNGLDYRQNIMRVK